MVSTAGPLTRSELELVQGVGDASLSPILPAASPVIVGEHWRVGDDAALAVSGYDVHTSNTLECRTGILWPRGRGSGSRGKSRVRASGAGTMTCEGFLTFDFQAGPGRPASDLNRSETRRPGPVEAGLDVKSTLTVTRNAAEPPATLSNAALATSRWRSPPRRERLRLTAPGGKAILLHDRRWHSFWDDPKLTVLKRLEGGQVIAQCNLSVGPPAGRDGTKTITSSGTTSAAP